MHIGKISGLSFRENGNDFSKQIAREEFQYSSTDEKLNKLYDLLTENFDRQDKYVKTVTQNQSNMHAANLNAFLRFADHFGSWNDDTGRLYGMIRESFKETNTVNVVT